MELFTVPPHLKGGRRIGGPPQASRDFNDHLSPSLLPHKYMLLANCDDLSQVDLDELLLKSTEQVRKGIHTEFVRRSTVLDIKRERCIAIADRQRKQQIRNINQLYAFEVENTFSEYQVSLDK